MRRIGEQSQLGPGWGKRINKIIRIQKYLARSERTRSSLVSYDEFIHPMDCITQASSGREVK